MWQSHVLVTVLNRVIGFPKCKVPHGMNFLPLSPSFQSWSCSSSPVVEEQGLVQWTELSIFLNLWIDCGSSWSCSYIKIWPVACHFLSWGSGSLNYPMSGWATWALSPLPVLLSKKARCVSLGASILKQFRKQSYVLQIMTPVESLPVLCFWWDQKFRWEGGNRFLWTQLYHSSIQKNTFIGSMPYVRC